MRPVLLSIAFLVTVGFVLPAQERPPQEGPRVLSAQGPIRVLGSGGSGPEWNPTVIYANTILSGLGVASPTPAGGEFIDWGVVVPSGHETVTNVAIGYMTPLSTTALRFRVYPGYTGWCAGLPNSSLDISLTGLPGSSTGTWESWVVPIDLSTQGLCYFHRDGPFGYSYTTFDSMSGPLLASGGNGSQDAIDIILPTGGCGTYWFSNPWSGLYAEFTAHHGKNTFLGGCHRGLTLDVAGPTCLGNTVSVTVSGAQIGDWWAFALGTTIGTGLGGWLGGCSVDVVPVVPIAVVGPLLTQPLTLPVVVTLQPGISLGMQLISRNPSTWVWDTSNTEILNVP